MPDVTQLRDAIDASDPKAADQLLPLIYDEFRKLAVRAENIFRSRGVVSREKSPCQGRQAGLAASEMI